MNESGAATPEVARDVRVAPAAPKSVPRWRRLLPLLGLGVLAYVLHRMNMEEMGRALRSVSLATILLASAAFTANMLIKVYRWQRLLIAQGILIELRVIAASYLSGQFYGQVTLGRAGEFLRMFALTERGVSAGAALASCLFDRLLDLFAVLLSGAVLSALVLGNTRIAVLALVVLVLGALGLASFLLLLGAPDSAAPPNFAQRWCDALQQKRGLSRVMKLVRDLAQGMRPMLAPRVLLEASLWTAIGWLGYFAALWQLADGMRLHVSHMLLTATAAFAALSALLPVTVSGLGARELIYIQVLQSQGVVKEQAVAISLLHLFVMSVSATFFGFLGVLWQRRLQRAALH